MRPSRAAKRSRKEASWYECLCILGTAVRTGSALQQLMRRIVLSHPSQLRTVCTGAFSFSARCHPHGMTRVSIVGSPCADKPGGVRVNMKDKESDRHEQFRYTREVVAMCRLDAGGVHRCLCEGA